MNADPGSLGSDTAYSAYVQRTRRQQIGILGPGIRIISYVVLCGLLLRRFPSVDRDQMVGATTDLPETFMSRGLRVLRENGEWLILTSLVLASCLVYLPV